MTSYSEKSWIKCGHADPGGYICIIYFQDCNLWHVLTSSNYTWSAKKIPEIEWDTQEETRPLELPHRLTRICCQIPSLSPGLSYDKKCYQWFTGKLNCFMDTYPPNSADQSTETTHSVAQWSLGDRFMFNQCKKVKKVHYWTTEPKFEFGGGETVIKTGEATNKIMIFFYGPRDAKRCRSKFRKNVVDGPDFDISSLLDFAMVISFAASSSFMSWYSIKYVPIIFIVFLLESSYMKT